MSRLNNVLAAAKAKYLGLSKVKKATLWFTGCSFLQRGVSFITVPIFTRLLTTAEYGSVSVYQSWEMVALYVITLGVPYGGFNNGMIRYKDDREGYTTSVSSLIVFMGLLWLALGALFSDVFTIGTGMSAIQTLLLIIEVTVVGIYEVWVARMRFDYEYNKLVPATLILAVAVPALGVPLVMLTSDKVLARILSFVIVEVVFAVVLGRFMLKRSKHVFNPEYWRFTLLFNIPLLPHYLSQVVLSSSDRIMIANFCTASEAGIYSIAYSAGMVMALLNSSLNSTVTPWVYRSMDSKEFKKIGRSCIFLLGGLALVILAVDVLAPEVVALLAPGEYSEASALIPVIAASVFFMFLYSYCSNIELYFEKTGLVSIASIAAAVLNVVLNAVCIPLFGYQAAGYTTLACYIVLGAAHYVFAQRVAKREAGVSVLNSRGVWGIAVLFVAASVVLPLLYPYPVVRYVVLVLTVIACFVFREKLIAKFKAFRSC